MKENIFHTIQDKNTAYWLGFIAADGSISSDRDQLEIGLSSKDRDQLEKFGNFIDYHYIHDKMNHCSNNDKYYPTSSIFIYSTQIKQDLAQYLIVPNKSHLDNNFLSTIPEKYKWPFICGLFDGDGWFSNTTKIQNFGFCGNKAIISAVIDYLNITFNWNLHSYNYTKSPTTYFFATQSQDKLHTFIINYLALENDCDLLNRKKNIAKNILQVLELKKAKKNNKYISNKSIALNKVEQRICPICNKIFWVLKDKEQIYCSQECSHLNQRIVKRPSREELKQLIRTMPFTQIGIKYKVSDNAIRKWCKAYNLPYTKKDIKTYSDKEWELI